MAQLKARIKQTGANAAVIVSMFRGNPGELSFVDYTGKELINIRMESAALRREVSPDSSTKNTACLGVVVKEDSSKKTLALAKNLSEWFEMEYLSAISPYDVQAEGTNHSFLWLEDLAGGKIIWTHYLTSDHQEIGPRIRISFVR